MQNLKIGIIGGKGKMGAYFKLFFKKYGYEVYVSDLNTELSNIELAQKCDVVIVSVPIEKTVEVIKTINPYVKKEALLMDLTSVKAKPVEAMLESEASVVGCHPMFAPTVSLKNQIIVLSRARGTKWYNWLKNLFKSAGAFVKELEPHKHDELMTVIQSLTHFTDITLAHSLTKSGIPLKRFLEYQSPAYRLKLDMTGRILHQDPSLYGNMQIQNPKTNAVLKTYLKSVKELIKIVKKKDLQKFIKYFQEGADYLGDFKENAQKESDLLIEFLNQQKTSSSTFLQKNKREKVKKLKTKKLNYDFATLGPANSYSDLVAKKYAKNAQIYYAKNIREVFELVQSGQIEAGIVPIENKIEGSIRETMDLLFETNLKIIHKIVLPIKHCLAVLPKTQKKDINLILSHSQPLGQCEKYIQKNFPKAEVLATSSTSEAMSQLQTKNLSNVGAIGSVESAQNLELKIYAQNIGDEKENETHFYVIKKVASHKLQATSNKKNIRNSELVSLNKGETEGSVSQAKLQTLQSSFQGGVATPTTNCLQTSIAFYFKEDTHGTLFGVLQEFNQAKINLTRIESRPAGKKMGNYVFYLDFNGDKEDLNVKKVLAKIEKKASGLKVFGSYAVRSF